ncbi:MarR family winged helix-turn-helix transcriptional regulator [Phycicoccus sp.]|uniref:MarR family winged helix-turn-helix transcriptional regulator n=1 Tax=Phycicoccus sp. TaxID=1902410 RepID=UPI002B69F92F|nr:MarR family winged helix-turn-helix transcriptional regulator [Phycicoccus sp.]HMM93657.1 MarR family winged helix-turn-helix transcriptional regulator [Phycicoccus sp.]
MSAPLTPDRLGPRLAEVYHLLGTVYRQVQRRVETDEPAMGMSVGVRAVLDALHRRDRPTTVPRLAADLELSRQFVQRMVNDALDAGWLERRDNPSHRRSVLLALTPAGRAAIDAVVGREHALMGATPGGLTEEDVATTLRVLAAMRTALDRLDRAPS